MQNTLPLSLIKLVTAVAEKQAVSQYRAPLTHPTPSLYLEHDLSISDDLASGTDNSSRYKSGG